VIIHTSATSQLILKLDANGKKVAIFIGIRSVNSNSGRISIIAPKKKRFKPYSL